MTVFRILAAIGSFVWSLVKAFDRWLERRWQALRDWLADLWRTLVVLVRALTEGPSIAGMIREELRLTRVSIGEPVTRALAFGALLALLMPIAIGLAGFGSAALFAAGGFLVLGLVTAAMVRRPGSPGLQILLYVGLIQAGGFMLLVSVSV